MRVSRNRTSTVMTKFITFSFLLALQICFLSCLLRRCESVAPDSSQQPDRRQAEALHYERPAYNVSYLYDA
ncbi:uncharacterized protein F4822DRAFT_414939 [Hypoxylon trugodes]|uniref:uncharacterized protein n=1 Tax=Hypoxylon trugodes TaxID=326681 RepID=UPI00219C5F5F|nr:uncharacterized protein F4822DRAFT_414939 [Hypoxylon trugodes]KAI1384374.1 hypothetical protein F4822DRAFT_414939 [Hypoxylon trugodes]